MDVTLSRFFRLITAYDSFFDGMDTLAATRLLVTPTIHTTSRQKKRE